MPLLPLALLLLLLTATGTDTLVIELREDMRIELNYRDERHRDYIFEAQGVSGRPGPGQLGRGLWRGSSALLI